LFGTAEKAIEVGKDAATKASEAATAVGEGVVSTALAETSAEATPKPELEDTAGEDTSSPELDPDALSGLDSYRVRMTSQWTPPEGPGEVMTIEQAHTREPAAQRFVIDMGDDVRTELVQIEDQAWYCSGGGCSQIQADPEDLASSFGDAMILDPADVTQDANARFVGRESLNGVQTRHYVLDVTDMQAAALARGEVANMKSDVWIADEPTLPSYTARFEMSWDETRGGDAGKSEFSYDVYDVNSAFAIEPPEGAESSSLPEDVPLYPDREDVFTVEGMITFTSPDDVVTVADFYRDALPGQGWTSETDEEMGDMVSQEWQKEERRLALMVAPEDEGSSVMIKLE
jgi:hypothetical protein